MEKVFVMGDLHGRFEALKEVLKKSGFGKKDTLIFLGDIVDGGFETKECVEELLKIKNLIYILGNHDCLDVETEALTKEGWKKYDQIKKTDKIYSFDIKKELGVWTDINKIIVKNYKGHLLKIVNSHIDMLVTPNHRILYSTSRKRQWRYTKAKDLLAESIIPTSTESLNEDYEIPDIYLKIISWILSDGSIYRESQTQIGTYTIWQSKPSVIREIIALLESSGLEFSHNQIKRKKMFIRDNKKITSPLPASYIRLKGAASKIINKYLKDKNQLPKWMYKLSNRQFDIVLDVFRKADGKLKGNIKSGFVLWGRKDILHEMQILCHTNNYRAPMQKHKSGAYYLNITKRNSTHIQRKTTEKIPYNGVVWCLNVPQTNFLVRRNNKIYFTGNCWFMNHIKTGWSEDIWLCQGGANTLRSYGAKVEEADYFRDKSKVDTFNLKIPETHKDFFNRGVYYYEHKGMLFVHGGFDIKKGVKNTDKETLLWDRSIIEHAKIAPIPGYKKVFIGHTSTLTQGSNPDVRDSMAPIWYNRLCMLDTGCGGNGKLTIMDVDTEEYWQSKQQKFGVR